MKRVTHVAGVTFCNEKSDGGESRQELLKQLYKQGPSTVVLEHTVYHNPETGLDEPAIKLRSSLNKKIIGWVPRTHIDALWKTDKMLLSIGYYKDTWSGVLAELEDPTPKQYRIMKALLAKKLILKKPEYERTIYGYWIEQVSQPEESHQTAYAQA